MDNVLVISNFNAGRKKAVLYKKSLVKFLLQKSKMFKFISVDDFADTDITEFDTIIAIGGDGTVSKAAERILNTDKTLICLPSGTANLLAANLGMSNNLKKNLKIMDKGKTKYIDVININGKMCVLRCGLGYDSDIICKTPQSLKNRFGYFAYFIAGIIFALRLSKKTYKMAFNGISREFEAAGIIIANAANMYKNLITVADNSSVNDGFIDVFILKSANPFLFFFEFLCILLGITRITSRAEYFKCKTIQMENNWTACHIDGEKNILKGDVDIKIKPNKLRVCCFT